MIDEAGTGADDRFAALDTALTETKSALDRLALRVARSDGAPASQASEPVDPAWQTWLRSGRDEGLSRLDTKALNSGTDSEGGYLAPAELDRLIEARLAATSPMRAIASVRQTGANVFRKPVSLGSSANWVAEAGARSETTAPSLSLLEFPAAELYAMPAATQTLLDDAYLDVDDWLASEVQDAFSAQESTAFVSGNGTNRPKGFLAYETVAEASHVWGKLGYLASGAAGAFAAGMAVEKLIDLVYSVKPQFRAAARFVMNRRTLATLRKLKDGTGAYIFRPGTGTEAASLLGYPVTEIEDMPDIGVGRPCDCLRRFRARLSHRRPAGCTGAARPLFGQALCPLLHDQACRWRGPELRCDQTDEVFRELGAA